MGSFSLSNVCYLVFLHKNILILALSMSCTHIFENPSFCPSTLKRMISVWFEIEITTKLLRTYRGKHTDLSAKPSSWPYAKVLFYCSLTKSFILGSTLKLLVNSNLRFLSCFYVQWRLSLRIMALIGLRCIPSLWCAGRHRCHTCWSSSWYPPMPNPILESQLLQSSSLFPRIPILALDQSL